MKSRLSQLQIERMRSVAEGWSPEEVLGWAFDAFEPGIEIASGFGAEGMVLLDLAARICPRLKVFTLDTGYIFPQTLELANKVEVRYGMRVERLQSEVTPDAQAQIYEPGLWNRDPDLCCEIRKIRPLKKKLASLCAWVTAIRRQQTPLRKNAGKVEWDSKFQLAKINPLADWTQEQVWRYIEKHGLAYNPLHDQGYPSIGCIQCTDPVSPEAPSRSGRWASFSKMECGLHQQTDEKSLPEPAGASTDAEKPSDNDRYGKTQFHTR
jgi:phosphoadenosine phosphosulfate reductase